MITVIDEKNLATIDVDATSNPSGILPLAEVLEIVPLEPKPKPATDANGNPILYTGPTFTYDPKRKTSPGSGLRIKPDGTVSYHNPNCLKYVAPGAKPFRMPALNPRTEGTAETFERLKAAIEKRAQKDKQRNLAGFVNRPVFDGWKIAATDGHTALLERGDGDGERIPFLDLWKQSARLICSIENPEFHLALKRALVMTEEKSAKVRFIANPGELKLASSHDSPTGETNDAGDFEETLPVNCADAWHVALDGDYVETVCGSWPLAVWFAGPDLPVVFEPADSSWRYIVQPIKDVWDGVEGIPAELKPAWEMDPKRERQTEEKQNGFCPVCGESVSLLEYKTLDGRLIGTCGDRFNLNPWRFPDQWKDFESTDDVPTKASIEPEISNPLDSNEPEQTPEPPADVVPVVLAVEPPAEPEPVKPEEPVKAEPHATRMLIGECIDSNAAGKVIEAMRAHILGAGRDVVRGDVLLEMEGNMVVMLLEFRTRIDAIRYSSERWHRQFLETTQHLCLGNYVLKLFANQLDHGTTPEPEKPNGKDHLDEPRLISCPQCFSQDIEFYDDALGYEAVRCNECFEETDLNNPASHCRRPDRISALTDAEKLERFKRGEYVIKVPPVPTSNWTDQDWIDYIDKNDWWRPAEPVTEPPAPECVHEWDDLTLAELPVCTKCNVECPEELIPKVKYLAISTNTDEQTTHYDYILARNENHALELIGELRPDCIPVSVFSREDLISFVDEIHDMPEVRIAEQMENLKAEVQS